MNLVGSVGFAVASALSLSTPVAANGLIETAAHCLDGNSIQSNQGSSPSATCSRGVSEDDGNTFRIGQTGAQARVTSTLQNKRYKQGVLASAGTGLATNGPAKLFGARAYVDVLDADWFEATAVGPDNLGVSGGTFFVNLRLTGSLMLGLTGSAAFDPPLARLRYTVVLENGLGESARAKGDLSLHSPGEQAVSDRISIPVAWKNEGRIDFSMAMTADAQTQVAHGVGNAYGISSFDSSLEWLGIDRVTDENGVPVASFLAVNPETGVNWGVPSAVPDPAVWVLLGAGLPLVALRCRQLRPERNLPGKLCPR